MSTYVFHVRLLANPSLGFEPESAVWREIEVDSSHTLADFHEAIFEAFDRRDTHGYEFLTHDADGVVTRSYVSPQLYDGGPSWPPMSDEQIDRFLDRTIPDDAPEQAKERFRDLRQNPPAEGNTAETTIEAIEPRTLKSMLYVFDMGDNWEHHVELERVRVDASVSEPRIVDEQGEAPSQYPER